MNKLTLLALSLSAIALTAQAKTTVTIDTWSNEGEIWQEKILPAFYAKNPDITMNYCKTNLAQAI